MVEGMDKVYILVGEKRGRGCGGCSGEGRAWK